MSALFSFRDAAGVGRRGARMLPLVLPVVLAAAFAGPAQAADGCDFYKGKTVELIVPFSAGGGFDAYGRLVAKYMGDELGAANMIVRNQPGAGGLLATNQTWTAKPDGLKIQLMSVSGMITSELGGADGVGFKSGQFSWIGRVSGEPDVIATAPNGSIKSLDDVKKIAADRKIRIGSSGVGDIDYIEAGLLAKMLGVETDVITGFSGSSEVYASLGRDELDFFVSSLSGGEAAEKAETARILWSFDTEAVPGRPEIKPLSEVVDAKFLPLIKAQAAVVAAGRALAAPPKVPEDRLKCLRDAFDRAMASEKLLDESKKINRPVAPLDGQKMTTLVRSVTDDAPKDYLELLHKAYAQ
ncbi:tripartite tricarboxylate transporter substrate-binding protein [Ancylobacter sp. MQZ15Z-1]|uniref:Tripartite tricarboxylate transporter substrate-binding protein n=1 Tax=Ancylobacter mangrovi TaxID=2972472 RepID=A0A9X2PEK7_9HYPH|nr:tripartite tricarboxylate transporter substrate-binding protein [Ancylobacter mangrovi]MCS0497262.1 tripartite tricarboxylate transporter substrate-binding protein [Ancylobacter mangrovi]